MRKNKNGVDFAGQEIVIGRVVIYANGGALWCGKIDRVTEKNVFLVCGKMIQKKKVFVLDDSWSIN